MEEVKLLRIKINKAAKNIVACSILSTLHILSNVSIANAQGSLESEFLSITKEYNPEDIIVENGVSIKKGEALDLSKTSEMEMSNNDIVKIDANGVVRPIDEGTVFLSEEINEKVYITEVNVSSSETKAATSPSMATKDRGYYKVFLDPGHGGIDNGASGFGYLEDELNLKVAKMVESKLKQKGIDVKMSRTSDVYLSLAERANMANSYGADVFMSIHQNAADNQSASGIETYYHTDKIGYKPYSNVIQYNAIQETSARNRGVKSANFVVLRETNMPSSLFESGFITNQEESKKLGDPVYQDKLASAIANGIETYLKENIKLTENSPVNEIINTGVVTASSLNVRSGYGTSNPVIGSVSKGTKVEVVESKNGWYKIKYKTGYGCISADYIKLDNDESKLPTTPEEKPPVVEVIKRGVVNATSLNVRSGYGTSYSKIGSISKGSKIEIVESKNGWYKIKYKTGYGCISADYIKLDNDESKLPTTPEEKPPVVEVIKRGVVNATSLNVRSGYGTSYSKIGSVSKGTKVEVVESKNGWYKIKYKTGYGYISGDYIKLDSSISNPPATSTSKTGVVNATSLNVRSGYGTSYSKIGSVSKATKVEIVESKNGWYKIKYKTGYGYISGDYIKLDSSISNPPATSTSKTGVVNATSLNVRSGYGASYSKIGSISKGIKVEVVESKNGWYKIKYKTGYGYVSAEYINL
jgi:N-acetylmuramoyl-L-alanine amidase/uncharacterized protein YraI